MDTQNQFLVWKQPLKEQYGFKITYHIVDGPPGSNIMPEQDDAK